MGGYTRNLHQARKLNQNKNALLIPFGKLGSLQMTLEVLEQSVKVFADIRVLKEY